MDIKCVLNVILLKFCSYAMFKTVSTLQLMLTMGLRDFHSHITNAHH